MSSLPLFFHYADLLRLWNERISNTPRTDRIMEKNEIAL